ncbi:hypothetical protein PIB30_077860 [Stylosanthes scabra]|uniref:indole-3-pyruvate monooxygenase n=1 Tax=Stylosanthes scabra TaxID=79078 RepID=A0ABU6ZP97_9FABA|nr:hypothetical protein [Stylosanthes scabra]
MEIIEVPVVIVGAGPAGIATAGCLNKLNIPNIVLERDDCNASFYRKRTHDNLKLHLDKKFCSLPHYPIPPSLPNFVTRVQFLRYIESYVAHFNVAIKYNRAVESAVVYERSNKWRVVAKDTSSGTYETYVSDFLVVATGENSEGYIPEIEGLDKYDGVYMHSSKPKEGPFAMKMKNGTTPIIDMGCVKKIKNRQVKVFPAILSIEEAKTVQFTNGQRAQFDIIIFATGYRTNVLSWLQDYEILFNEDGMPIPSYPNHWGGEQGIYCAGFSRLGLEGISYDAKNIANHIQYTINLRESFNH